MSEKIIYPNNSFDAKVIAKYLIQYLELKTPKQTLDDGYNNGSFKKNLRLAVYYIFKKFSLNGNQLEEIVNELVQYQDDFNVDSNNGVWGVQLPNKTKSKGTLADGVLEILNKNSIFR